MNIKNFKEEESIEILKVLSLIANIGKYQELYNHAWRKNKSKIGIDKYRWNKKLLH